MPTRSAPATLAIGRRPVGPSPPKLWVFSGDSTGMGAVACASLGSIAECADVQLVQCPCILRRSNMLFRYKSPGANNQVFCCCWRLKTLLENSRRPPSPLSSYHVVDSLEVCLERTCPSSHCSIAVAKMTNVSSLFDSIRYFLLQIMVPWLHV